MVKQCREVEDSKSRVCVWVGGSDGWDRDRRNLHCETDSHSSNVFGLYCDAHEMPIENINCTGCVHIILCWGLGAS